MDKYRHPCVILKRTKSIVKFDIGNEIQNTEFSCQKKKSISKVLQIVIHSSPTVEWSVDLIVTTVESRYNVLPRGCKKKYDVTIVRCIRTENFPLHEIETWEKVRYNGEYAVNGVRCNAISL